MTFKMSDKDRIITIYNLLSATNEFIGKGDGFIPANTGLPAYSTDIAPPSAKDGFVAVFNIESEKWSLIEDHRGKVVYDIHTGNAITFNQLGKLPDDVVSVAPDGDFAKWDGEKWNHDTDAERNAKINAILLEKNRLIKIVSEEIEILKDAIELGIATDDEQKKLVDLKKKRIELSRVNPSNTESIDDLIQ